MGYVPPPLPPPRLNLDRHGMPRDYATYMWLIYRKRVDDRSPARMSFLHGPHDGSLRMIAERMQATIFGTDFGSQEIMR